MIERIIKLLTDLENTKYTKKIFARNINNNLVYVSKQIDGPRLDG